MSECKILRSVAFGLQSSLPLRGFPQGKARIRARNDEFVLVRIRTTDGIREYYVKEVDGFWEPAFEKGFNLSNEGQQSPTASQHAEAFLRTIGKWKEEAK